MSGSVFLRLFAVIFLLGTIASLGAATVTGLRTGGQVNPLGLDDRQPVLSWRLESEKRGAAQSAYRVLVASAADLLANDQGDLWDTGRVDSDENVRVVYAGQPLRSSETVFWKVRAWDETGQASPWSAPATWTAGVLNPKDWAAGTRWISDPELLRWQRSKLGYRSQPAKEAETPKWLTFDLGRALPIEAVRLRAVAHTVDENLGFPRRYRLEVADRADFSDARVVAESTQDHNPWVGLIQLPLKGVTGRYVRFTATKLRIFHGEACLAVSQVEIQSNGRNVAPEAKVTASDTFENAQWSLAAVNDGLGVPGANPRASDTLLLQRAFTVRPGLKRALLHISGLGHSVMVLNGERVAGDRRFTPGWTDYRRTILYDTHDLTAQLHPGPNALALTLGGGMYNVQTGFGRYAKFTSAYRPLMAFGELRLEYADGQVEVIGTDGQWRAAPGPTTYANIFGGEDHDARRQPSGWAAAAVTDGPGGVLRGAAWSSPALVAHESFAPAKVTEIKPGVSVYDFGQNAAMMPRLRVRGPAGAVVRLIPAELVRGDGTVNRGSSGGGNAWWQYTLRGDAGGEEWFPDFFYHGARYLQAELYPANGGSPLAGDRPAGRASSSNTLPAIEKLESVVVHSDSPSAGTFACSNERFNRIHGLVRWAQRNNFAHVLSDCPHRERLGWLEQYHLNGPALRYGWDLGRLFAKGFNDMADAQRPSGHLPSIAPEYVVFDGAFVDSPEWGSALILAGWQHYLFTGDAAPLRRHYGAMQRYFDYLGTRADGHILAHGLGDWYDRGPNPPGVAQLTPVALTATAIYFEDAMALARIADILGRPDEASKYRAKAGEIGRAFSAKFLDAETGVYATGSQTAQAMPLALGLAPDRQEARVLGVLLKDIADRGNAVTAGDVGYRYLLRALADTGRSDALFAMNNQSDKPGYGYQLAQGATSLTEAWDANPRNSQSHFMLGQINEWFYQDLAGLGVDPVSPGFKNVIVRPQPVGDVTWAEASHESPYGLIKVRWERAEGKFALKLTVPPNSTATVHLPAREVSGITESGRPALGNPGIRCLRREGDREIYQVTSGTYTFESNWVGPR